MSMLSTKVIFVVLLEAFGPAFPEAGFVMVCVLLRIVETDYEETHVWHAQRAVGVLEKRLERAVRRIAEIVPIIDIDRAALADHRPFVRDFPAGLPCVTVSVEPLDDGDPRGMRFRIMRRPLAGWIVEEGHEEHIALLATRDRVDMIDHLRHDVGPCRKKH
jgi:hypothetical protein